MVLHFTETHETRGHKVGIVFLSQCPMLHIKTEKFCVVYIFYDIVMGRNKQRTAVEFALNLIIISRRKDKSKLAGPCFELTVLRKGLQLHSCAFGQITLEKLLIISLEHTLHS